MRHYAVTFAAYNLTPERRIRDVRRALRTQVSRRRFRQAVRSALNKSTSVLFSSPARHGESSEETY